MNSGEKFTVDDLRHQFENFTTDTSLFFDISSKLSSETINNLNDFGFILFAPECFKLGVAYDIFLDIISRGFMILDLKILEKINEEQLSNLYLPQVKPYIPAYIPSDFRWWLLQKRFSAGPIAGLIVKKTTIDNVSCHDLLGKNKGFRIPYRADKQTIRNSFPAINGILNLIHTSDDAAFFIRESTAIFTTTELAEVLELKKESDPKVLQNALIMYQDCSNELNSFFSVYYKTIFLILHRNSIICEKKIRDQIVEMMPSDNITESWEERTGKLLNFVTGAKEKLFSDISPKSLKASPNAIVLDSFLNFTPGENGSWLEILELIRAAGIKLSNWEELVLLSSLYYFKDFFPVESDRR